MKVQRLFDRLKSASDKIMSIPIFYTGLRTIFLGGLPTVPLLNLLEPQPDDIILDIGCGTGFLSTKIPFQGYFGFDSDQNMIRIAKKRNIPRTHFAIADVQEVNFSALGANKAVLYGILHHLSDEKAIHLLKQLATSVQWVVTLDPVYDRFHLLNNLLCRMDRGTFVRTEKKMDALVTESGMKIDSRLIHYANTKVAKYLSYRLVIRSCL